jgi:hypothetical protein
MLREFEEEMHHRKRPSLSFEEIALGDITHHGAVSILFDLIGETLKMLSEHKLDDIDST